MIYTLIGGDERMIRLGKQLARDGNDIRTAYQGEGNMDLKPALENTNCVILPLPADDGKMISTPKSKAKLTVDELVNALPENCTVLAGKPSSRLTSAVFDKGPNVIDYFLREELTVKNAEITAEAALQLAMNELPRTLHGTRCLVVGFGRIGKLLTIKLRNLNADVTATARKAEDIAWMNALGIKSAETHEIDKIVKNYDLIINTVPYLIISETVLKNISGALIIDLASKPGGVDFEAANKLHIKAIQTLALPGRYAPESAASAIKDTIYNIVKELECPN